MHKVFKEPNVSNTRLTDYKHLIEMEGLKIGKFRPKTFWSKAKIERL